MSDFFQKERKVLKENKTNRAAIATVEKYRIIGIGNKTLVAFVPCTKLVCRALLSL